MIGSAAFVPKASWLFTTASPSQSGERLLSVCLNSQEPFGQRCAQRSSGGSSPNRMCGEERNSGKLGGCDTGVADAGKSREITNLLGHLPAAAGPALFGRSRAFYLAVNRWCGVAWVWQSCATAQPRLAGQQGSADFAPMPREHHVFVPLSALLEPRRAPLELVGSGARNGLVHSAAMRLVP